MITDYVMNSSVSVINIKHIYLQNRHIRTHQINGLVEIDGDFLA